MKSEKFIGDICFVTDYVSNGSFASLKQNVEYCYEPNYAMLVRTTDQTKKWNGKYVYVTEESYNFLSKSRLYPGDIIMANVGEPGKAFILPDLGMPMTLGPNAIIVRPTDTNYVNKFLYFYFISPIGQKRIQEIVTGTAVKKFNKTSFKKINVPSITRPEQQVIVSKIEELLSKLDNGVKSLKAMRQQLKIYRQAVLKWAFEGRLTNGNVMNGVLPEGWGIYTVGDICKSIVPNRDKPKSFTGKIKWITTPNLVEGSIKLNYEEVSLGLSDQEVLQYKAKTIPIDSVIMTCVGNLGLSAIVERPIVINQQLHAFLPNKDIAPKYLAFCIQNNKGYFLKRATSTTILYLNKENCDSMPLPLPSIEIQHQIVQEIESRLSVCDKIEETINKSLKEAESLKQSILKQAFEGKLV